MTSLVATLALPAFLWAAPPPPEPPPGGGLPTPVEAQSTKKKEHDPLRPETYEQCMSTRTLPALLAAGAKSWGFPREDFQARLDELAGVVQCQALAGGEKACATLGKIPDLPAAETLETECRSEHHLLVFYREMTRGTQGAAQESCVRWMEANRKYISMSGDIPGACRMAVEALAEDPVAGCAKLGKQVGKLPRATRKDGVESELICNAYLSPSEDSCGTEEIPVSVRTCVDYGRVLAALRSKRAKACPAGPRRRSACRALLSSDPASACAAAAGEWTRKFCQTRFR